MVGVLPTMWIPKDLRITNAQAENVSVVYACIRAISEALASSPWQVYRVTGRSRELAPDDAMAYLLNQRPNPEITAVSFREVLCHWALSEGNGYAEIERSMTGTPIALWPLDSTRMLPARPPAGTWFTSTSTTRVSRFGSRPGTCTTFAAQRASMR